jgi:hypothetical protein
LIYRPVEVLAIAGYIVNYLTPNEEHLVDFHRKTIKRLGLPARISHARAQEVAQRECKKQLHEVEFIKNLMHLMKIAGVGVGAG